MNPIRSTFRVSRDESITWHSMQPASGCLWHRSAITPSKFSTSDDYANCSASDLKPGLATGRLHRRARWDWARSRRISSARRLQASPGRLPDELDDATLEARLFTRPQFASDRHRPLPDWPQLYQELKKLGVTLQLRWVEYRAQHPTGYGHTPTALNGSRSPWFGACA